MSVRGASVIWMLRAVVEARFGKVCRSLSLLRMKILRVRSGGGLARRCLRMAEPVAPVAPRSAWVGILEIETCGCVERSVWFEVRLKRVNG